MSVSYNKQVYDNIAMLSPEGQLMCYIGSKRANWYLQRDLADKLEEKKIQLKFRPNGLGHYYDPERNIPVDNHCVVCGHDEISKLTKHHSVPECFRKYFPDEWKSYRSHEILFICTDCHERYERYASDIKRDLIAALGGEEIMNIDNRMRKYINTLLKHKKLLPEEKRLRLENEIKEHYKISVINDSVLKQLLKKPRINPYRLYAQQVENHFEFARFWKQHFLDIMKPKYLFAYWRPEYEPLKKNQERQEVNNVV